MIEPSIRVARSQEKHIMGGGDSRQLRVRGVDGSCRCPDFQQLRQQSLAGLKQSLVSLDLPPLLLGLLILLSMFGHGFRAIVAQKPKPLSP